MSFFDPANIFGGGGSRVRDPLGLFGGGRQNMTPEEIAVARGGGGHSQRANAFGGGFGGASGFRGQGLRESDFGGPAEMSAQTEWGNRRLGSGSMDGITEFAQHPAAGQAINRTAPQAQPQWGQLANALAQNQGMAKGPAQMGPNPLAMMGAAGQPSGGYQYGAGGMARGNGSFKGNPAGIRSGYGTPASPEQVMQVNRFLGRGPRG